MKTALKLLSCIMLASIVGGCRTPKAITRTESNKTGHDLALNALNDRKFIIKPEGDIYFGAADFGGTTDITPSFDSYISMRGDLVTIEFHTDIVHRRNGLDRLNPTTAEYNNAEISAVKSNKKGDQEFTITMITEKKFRYNIKVILNKNSNECFVILSVNSGRTKFSFYGKIYPLE